MAFTEAVSSNGPSQWSIVIWSKSPGSSMPMESCLGRLGHAMLLLLLPCSQSGTLLQVSVQHQQGPLHLQAGAVFPPVAKLQVPAASRRAILGGMLVTVPQELREAPALAEPA